MSRFSLPPLFGWLLLTAICCGVTEGGVITFTSEVGCASGPVVIAPCLAEQADRVVDGLPLFLESDGGRRVSRTRSGGGPEYVASSPLGVRPPASLASRRLATFERLRIPDGFAMCLLKIPIASFRTIDV